MTMLAHSARSNRGILVQNYVDHIRRVTDIASENAEILGRYSTKFGRRLLAAVRQAAEYHDLGKLDQANQAVLATGPERLRLPINHSDAGTAALLRTGFNSILASVLVYSHHIGLPDFVEQSNRRAEDFLRDLSLKSEIDNKLDHYLHVHADSLGFEYSPGVPEREQESTTAPLTPLALRLALSCLVDADHQDTAEHYGQAPAHIEATLEPTQRLGLLDRYTQTLAGDKQDERTRLRQILYMACRNTDIQPAMYACDAPVGSGKTTSVMAHLLNAAIVKNLRRVIVVLPFTNIIDQSVVVYRRSLVNTHEVPEAVVAGHHHRAEFDHPDSRHLTYLWKPPIIVTTAVQFFETLAAFKPAALRKLHNLPGSAIFIDESHAALPVRLWPLAWRWLRELAEDWGCHIILGSGSLNRFWELEEFSDPPASIPDLGSTNDKPQLSKYEIERIEYKSYLDKSLDIDGLVSAVQYANGPRLLIVNTVQSAAFIASEISNRDKPTHVEHLSTALCPRDRSKTLQRVRQRLSDPNDTDWTLVATSCVEAGVDLSFHTGFRERCSLNSLVQTAGRVNRNGEYDDSKVWDFELQSNGLLRMHPGFKYSARVLRELFMEKMIRPDSATEAMRREVRLQAFESSDSDVLLAEQAKNFPMVTDMFRVIESETVTVVVDPVLRASLSSGQRVNPEELMQLSVPIYSYLKHDYALQEFKNFPGLFAWTLAYDDFLGYMAGIVAINPPAKGAFFS